MKRTFAIILSTALLSTPALAVEATTKKTPAEVEKRAEERFKKSDINGDGTLSKEEFLARSEKRFAEIDTDHDGKISPKEMKANRQVKRAAHEKRMADKAQKTPTSH